MALFTSQVLDDYNEETDKDEEEDEWFLAILVEILREVDASTSWKMRFLTEEGRRRRDRCIPRAALVPPRLSPWQKLYSSGNNQQALITVTGFDHEAFSFLLDRFAPLFLSHTPWTGQRGGGTYRRLQRSTVNRKGRKRVILPHSCLGLVLSWYRFRGAEYILQGWFGFNGTHANVWLRFSRRMLLKTLQEYEPARPLWPSANKIESLKEVVAIPQASSSR